MTNTSQARPVLNGRYELHRRIARGGMADVFLARDQLLDRPVAVKVLFAQYAAEPTFVARFRREAQAAGKLNHPNIVAVYDWGQHEDTYFIVMEYVEGRTLAEVIANEGHLNPQRSAQVASDVAAALSFAHRNGTVHRDVKPGNIMITNDGQVKVADFGIARAFGAAEDELTQTGSVMGTASYFSPEQAQGKNVDPRSDLYALGVVLFEMVSGSPPFVGDSPVAIAYKHVQEPAPLVTTKNPASPQPLTAIIDQLLQKDPRSRYPAAEEVRVDLRNFLESRPLVGINGAAPVDQHATTAMAAAPATTAMAAATQAMPAQQDTGSARAVIDTSRAVPASAAVHQTDTVEEYYEPPSRTGVFIVMLGFLLLLLGFLIWFIAGALNDDGSTTADNLVSVPNVVDKDFASASAELTDLGFQVGPPVLRVTEDAEPDIVLEQDPEAEEQIAEGSTITLTISSAGETVSVPNLTGQSQSQARTALTERGLVPDIGSSEADPTIPIDSVVRTEPAAGTDVNEGSTVRIILSSGPGEFEVPDVSNMSVEDAKKLLEEAGFSVTRTVDEASGTIIRDNVIRSSPAAGEQADPESTISLFVSTGGEVTMPRVVGLTKERAIERLTAIGFDDRDVLLDQVPFPAGDSRIGIVLDPQSPAANATVQLPDTVRLRVGVLENTTIPPTTEDTTPPTTDDTTPGEPTP